MKSVGWGTLSMFARIWIWLTQSPSWSYARTVSFGGIVLLVMGFVLLAVGHSGNAGLPHVAAGALTLGIGVLASWFAAAEAVVGATLPRGSAAESISARRPPRCAASQTS